MMYRTLFFLALFITAKLFAQESENTILKTFHSISSHDLLNYAAELSSDKYKGRLSGSPEYIQAAQWVADQLKQAGVKPGISDGTYFQWFPNAYSEVFSTGSVTLLDAKNKPAKNYKFPDDFFPGSNSASGKVSGEVVYAGFGISAPELGYDDYKNLDVKGKIVLIESGTPYSKNDSALKKWEPYTYARYKFKHAREMGAVGLLLISKLANPNTSFVDGLVYAHISEQVAGELFSASGQAYTDARKSITQKMQPNSFPLKQKIQISASTKNHPDSRSCNVVGIIEGTDPELKSEAIIVGAHLDAVGSAGCVFPGALDNASGSSDILAAAKAFASSEIKPGRTVIFIFFGGEECGLFGSSKYVESPIWPKEKVVGMINLDMVGNGTGFLLGNGKTYPELANPLQEANNKYIHRDMKANEWQKNYGRPRTDAAIFQRNGYKTIELWTTGTVKTVYYHHPLDNTDGLTPELMEDAAKLLYVGLLNLSNDKSMVLK
jgi:hypothetical protein